MIKVDQKTLSKSQDDQERQKSSLFSFPNLSVSIPGSFKKQIVHSQAIHDSSEDKLETTIPVDGSEIRLTNQLRLVVYLPLFTRVYTFLGGGCLGFLKHQQYHLETWLSSSNPGAFKSGFTIRCTCFTGAFRPRDSPESSKGGIGTWISCTS